MGRFARHFHVNAYTAFTADCKGIVHKTCFHVEGKETACRFFRQVAGNVCKLVGPFFIRYEENFQGSFVIAYGIQCFRYV